MSYSENELVVFQAHDDNMTVLVGTIREVKADYVYSIEESNTGKRWNRHEKSILGRVHPLESESPVLMTRENLIAEALKIVTQDRNLSYGAPEDNFSDIAKFWNIYLNSDEEIKAHDVAVMMVLVKIARLKVSPNKRDHWADGIGYFACGGQAFDATNF